MLDLLTNLCMKNPRSQAVKQELYRRGGDLRGRGYELKIPVIKLLRELMHEIYDVKNVEFDTWPEVCHLKEQKEAVEYLFGYDMSGWNPPK